MREVLRKHERVPQDWHRGWSQENYRFLKPTLERRKVHQIKENTPAGTTFSLEIGSSNTRDIS